MKKKRLLFDATVIANAGNKDSSRSGIFFVAYNVLSGLLKQGSFDIYLYCDIKRLPYLSKVEINGRNILEQCKIADLYSENDIKLSRLYYLKAENKKGKGGKLEKIKIKLKMAGCKLAGMFINSAKFQAVKDGFLRHIDLYFSPMESVPEFIAAYKNIKKFVFLHDTIPLIYPEFYPEMQKGNYWYQRLISSINKDDFYVANSENTKQDFVRLVPAIDKDKIMVTPLAASENFYCCKDAMLFEKAAAKYNIPAGKRYIFSLCTLEPRKNLIFAVKCFVEFIRENKIEDLCLVMGGGQWNRFIGKLENEIENFSEFSRYIVKAGYVDDEDLAVLFSNAEFFIYPSLYEGFGMPVLEAMQCGCPVISSDRSSIPEVLGDAGLMVNPEDKTSLKDAFGKLYNNEALRKHFSTQGLERVKQFSWKNCTDLMAAEMLK